MATGACKWFGVTMATASMPSARWLSACVGSLRFESEMRAPSPTHTAAQKLGVLAGLQRAVRACGLSERDHDEIVAAIGAVGGAVESESRIVTMLSRSPAPLLQKLQVLLRLAAGEAAPIGPAADRARAEAIKLFRAPDSRAILSAAPETLAPLRGLMKAAGLAA